MIYGKLPLTHKFGFIHQFTFSMPSLSDQLKSLGVQVGAKDLKPPPATNPYSIERVLNGRILSTSLGDTYVVESRYPLDYTQGTSLLWTDQPLNLLASWAQDERINDLAPQAFAFLDTETTGLSGGTGTYAFLIGVGRIQSGEFYLTQFFMRDPVYEPGQLAALEEFIATCSALVTFNGKSFDMPLLHTRYLSHGWTPPFSDQAHIDLLHLARRLWRDRLPSRTLPNLELQILGTTRTEEDVPGWMIPQIFFDYLRSGDARPLKSIFYHNAMDVLSLAALLSHIINMLAEPLNGQIEHSLDIIAMAKLFEELGFTDLAIQLYLQGIDIGLPEEAAINTMLRLATIHKRQENFAKAIPLWEQAAKQQQLHAHVELAKYYEHRAQNFQQAIFWTESALSVVNDPNFPKHEKPFWKSELEHRLKRLHRKHHG